MASSGQVNLQAPGDGLAKLKREEESACAMKWKRVNYAHVLS